MSNNYTTGTASITNGSFDVFGTGTYWVAQANTQPGAVISFDGIEWYKIFAVKSDVALRIMHLENGTAYEGEDLENATYEIVHNRSGNLNAQVAPQLFAGKYCSPSLNKDQQLRLIKNHDEDH